MNQEYPHQSPMSTPSNKKKEIIFFNMLDHVYTFLQSVLGTEGAQALRKAVAREPALEPLLVPRAALAWLQHKNSYEGLIPGIPNSYLRFEKSEQGYSGTITLEQPYSFTNKDSLHLASALGVATGVTLSSKVQDQALVRLGKSIDNLVKAQELFKAEIRNSIFAKRTLDPNQGYTFHVEHTPTSIKIHTKDSSNNNVGTAWFNHTPHGLKPIVVGVDDAHQRKGIASAMYDHAKKVTGKGILPGDVQTDEGAAFRSTYKTELPGMTAQPKAQSAAVAPQAPIAQTTGASKPKLPKLPTLKVEKNEAATPCHACGALLFKNEKFTGCVCFKILAKHIDTIAYKDGYVLQFRNVDRATFAAIQKALKSQ